MLLSKRVFDEYKLLKLTDDPDTIIKYIDSIDGNYIPTSMLIDKARAIMLSNNQKYSLEDAENIFLSILELDHDCIQVYIELAYFYDSIMDDQKSALNFIEIGLKKTESIINDLQEIKKDILDYLDKFGGEP